MSEIAIFALVCLGLMALTAGASLVAFYLSAGRQTIALLEETRRHSEVVEHFAEESLAYAKAKDLKEKVQADALGQQLDMMNQISRAQLEAQLRKNGAPMVADGDLPQAPGMPGVPGGFTASSAAAAGYGTNVNPNVIPRDLAERIVKDGQATDDKGQVFELA